MKYKIGQILVLKEDFETEKLLSGDKVKIKKGNRIIIGADKLAHHIKTEMIQPLSESSEVDGYDATGLAEYLYRKLCCNFEMDEMLEGYDYTKDEFTYELEDALNEIGF